VQCIPRAPLSLTARAARPLVELPVPAPSLPAAFVLPFSQPQASPPPSRCPHPRWTLPFAMLHAQFDAVIGQLACFRQTGVTLMDLQVGRVQFLCRCGVVALPSACRPISEPIEFPVLVCHRAALRKCGFIVCNAGGVCPPPPTHAPTTAPHTPLAPRRSWFQKFGLRARTDLAGTLIPASSFLSKELPIRAYRACMGEGACS
jgi:hypothetical protein